LLNSYQKTAGDDQLKIDLIKTIQKDLKTKESDYLKVIEGLTPKNKNTGTLWLQGIVDQVVNGIMEKVKA